MRAERSFTALVGLLLWVLLGCGAQQATVVPPTAIPETPFPQEAQAVLDRLNSLDPTMFDLAECPDRYPPGFMSRYAGGWLSQAERELKGTGSSLRWNCKETKYELTTEESPKPICDCPPPVVEMSDLVGNWQAQYTSAPPGMDSSKWTGSEVLTLRADGTYQQVYDDGTGDVQTSPWNKWWIEDLPNGRMRVWLENGRFYPLEMVDGAPAGGPYEYHTPDDGIGCELRLDGLDVALGVNAFFPDVARAYLTYPPVGNAGSRTWVTFYWAVSSTPTTPP